MKLRLSNQPATRPPRRQRPATHPRRRFVRPPEMAGRWVAFEQGRHAHHLRDDDLFPAERTLCGKPALDADFQRLPIFNALPADYFLCRVCCVLLYRVRP